MLRSQLKSLARLHKLDAERNDLSRQRNAIVEAISSLRAAVASLETDLAKQREALVETSRLRKSQEAELKATEDVIGRAKSKMAGVKNTREYMAAEREVEAARKAAAMVEEQVVQLMEAEEKGQEALGARETKLAELRKDTEEHAGTALAEADILATRLAEVEAGRSALLIAIDRPLLSRYDRINKVLQGAAMSAVVDGICSSCNMNLPAQLFNILMRAETVETCPNCKRIIYWAGLLEEDGPSVDSPIA